MHSRIYGSQITSMLYLWISPFLLKQHELPSFSLAFLTAYFIQNQVGFYPLKLYLMNLLTSSGFSLSHSAMF